MATGGMIGLAYDPEKAKAGVEKVWKELNDLKTLVDGGLDAAKAHEAVQHYRQLPSYQINWGLIGACVARGGALLVHAYAVHLRVSMFP